MPSRILTVAFVLALCGSAYAWSEAGHKVTGSIAFRQLSPDQQAKIVAILKNHPRWKEDFESKMPAELTTDDEKNEWLFQQMAVWPDMARGFQGEDRKYNHPTWHYIDLPVYLTPEDKTAMDGKLTQNMATDCPDEPKEALNAIQALKLSRKMLVDPKVPDDQKAVMLCWLFHLVGDIHQPLHSAMLCSVIAIPRWRQRGQRNQDGSTPEPSRRLGSIPRPNCALSRSP